MRCLLPEAAIGLLFCQNGEKKGGSLFLTFLIFSGCTIGVVLLKYGVCIASEAGAVCGLVWDNATQEETRALTVFAVSELS